MTRFRTVAVIGPDGAGKSEFAEAVHHAFERGVTEVHSKDLDAEPTERKRNFSLGMHFTYASVSEARQHSTYASVSEAKQHSTYASVSEAKQHSTYSRVGETKLNFIDTPGFSDFAYEAEIALTQSDAAVLMLSATADLGVETDYHFNRAARHQLPVVVCLNIVDKPTQHFDRSYEELGAHLGIRTCPLTIPYFNAGAFAGLIDVLDGTLLITGDGAKTGFGETAHTTLPADAAELLDTYRTRAVELIAENDDALMEKYFGDKALTFQELTPVLVRAFTDRKIVPVFATAAQIGAGICSVLELLAEGARAPAHPIAFAADGKSRELKPRADQPFVARVIKTITDNYGRLTIAHVVSGTLAPGARIAIGESGEEERYSGLAKLNGTEQHTLASAVAGDIVTFVKTRAVKTGQTLVALGESLRLADLPAPPLVHAVALKTSDHAAEDKLWNALQKVLDDDPALAVERATEPPELLLRGSGPVHLEVALEKLRTRYGVEVTATLPGVAYRETITRSAQGHGRQKKQSGGRGQFGDIKVEFSPLARGEGFKFIDAIVGECVPRNYLPSVEKGVLAAMEHGPIGGFRVVDLAARAYDGAHHSVDSSDIAFQVAGRKAFRDAQPNMGFVLLEPLVTIAIEAFDTHVGPIMNDLGTRRGHVSGVENEGRLARIRAEVPAAELRDYASTLRALSGGLAAFTMRDVRYVEVPPHLVDRIVAEHKRHVGTEED